jgi:hypothetical protein
MSIPLNLVLVCLQIVNCRSHLKFPEEAKLSPEAKNLIRKLLCNVEQRLGTKGAHEIKVCSLPNVLYAISLHCSQVLN